MADDDDWFERALRELDEEEAAEARETANGEGEGPELSEEPDHTEAEADDTQADDADDHSRSGDTFDSTVSEDSEGSEGSEGSEAPETVDPDGDLAEAFGSDRPGDGDTAGNEGREDDTADAGDDGSGTGDDPFAEDFTTALDNAPSPAGTGGENGGSDEDFGFGDFGGGGAGGGGAGGGGAGGGGAGGDFDERAGGSFGGGGGDEDFGFGDFGGGGGDGDDDFGFSGNSFDEEEFESDIDRIRIGIEGLDEMILGGVPKRSLMVAIGSAGTGKTTFGLQFLQEALENGESAVYITLEESREAILSTAEEKGWPFRKYDREGRLAIIALDPIEMANSLASIRNDLPRLIDDFGASRLVLDSVSLLEMMYDHPSKRRSEVFDFTRSLKEVGVTTMLTSEASEESPYASRHGIVEYLTDAVFVLQYVRPSDFRETRLAVEIQKIRDANHSRETKPYEITNEGISVYRQANIF
ncbi:KaiC domain protein, AF_0351 family [Halogranum gelatinilyticum]|uniref:KaiC domain protein, AF_0351 family n=1 Tax=Halogranum gelatinilyticum TaxID=660521 RepID=A0A1G9TQP8_9EURY|nr:KaiC domain-containing protein [Halogranum gelatinilyticum]SDM50119.1 KaiC domain protein, AF_0351 family [Halogranum gelatinilyticum]